jgi:predicted transcriptional regulator of viral defense system
MVRYKENIRLSDWIDQLLSEGRISFTYNQFKESYSELSEVAVKRSIDRLTAKGKIISIYKGYYLIIPPQYISTGILPPSLFIDGLMNYLNRPYYLGLLNAAAYYGAIPQKTNNYSVFTDFPVLRPTQKKDIKIFYISKKHIKEHLLKEQKTELGYCKISSPELTAIDLVQFEKRVGGLNTAALILNKLTAVIRPEQINESLLHGVPVTAIQRLGYILDIVLLKKIMADRLYEQSKRSGLTFFRIPLKFSSPTLGYSSDERWKVIANETIEIDK